MGVCHASQLSDKAEKILNHILNSIPIHMSVHLDGIPIIRDY